MIGNKVKSKHRIQCAISIYYGKEHQVLNVVAENKTVAMIWFFGLTQFSDRERNGQTTAYDMIKMDHLENISILDDIVDARYVDLVYDSKISHCDLTATQLLEHEMKLKVELQKCVEFINIQSNYRNIDTAGQFDNVKIKLKELDGRLRSEKKILTEPGSLLSNRVLMDIANKLLRCDNEIDAFKEKLTAIGRGNYSLTGFITERSSRSLKYTEKSGSKYRQQTKLLQTGGARDETCIVL